jgi:hypothetical protein
MQAEAKWNLPFSKATLDDVVTLAGRALALGAHNVRALRVPSGACKIARGINGATTRQQQAQRQSFLPTGDGDISLRIVLPDELGAFPNGQVAQNFHLALALPFRYTGWSALEIPPRRWCGNRTRSLESRSRGGKSAP